MEKEKVLKVIKNVWLIIATALSVIFIAVCIIGGVKTHKEKNQPKGASACVEYGEVINIQYERAVSYDDDDNEIHFTNDEANYTFINFIAFLDSNYDDFAGSVDIFVNGDYYYYAHNSSRFINEGDANIFIICSDYFYISVSNTEYTLYEYLISNDVNGWAITCEESVDYQLIKQSVELDIQANQTINDSVFETLTSSTVGFIGTISSGITSMIAVFYSDNALTVIGTLSVIVVAISLAYFLFRLIIGLIRMRG